MNYKYYMKSDIGTTYRQNQDMAMVKTIRTRSGRAFMGIVCDGMGGMADGGGASGFVVSAVENWFEKEFPKQAEQGQEAILSGISGVISMSNRHILELGKERQAASGTTLSLLLILDGKYYVAQLGDSRVYLSSGGGLVQITEDHSYVMDKVRQGLMTREEAESSHSRNIITRCIGCTEDAAADFFTGDVNRGDMFLISSDGFHGGVDIESMNRIFSPCRRIHALKRTILSAIDQRKKNGEKDNITALVVMAV